MFKNSYNPNYMRGFALGFCAVVIPSVATALVGYALGREHGRQKAISVLTKIMVDDVKRKKENEETE